MKKGKVYLGTVSCGTMRPEDLIHAFINELRRIRGALPRDVARDNRAFLAGRMPAEDAAEFCSELFDHLNNYAPDYCYFGAHPGDGADYGFWLSEDWEQLAREDGVLFVGDTSEVPASHDGLVAHVNDHGNVTLYAVKRGKFREIWGVV